jgi:hypothetical protein
MRKHSHAGRGVKVAGLASFGDEPEPTRDEITRQRLRVRVPQLGRRDKRSLREVFEYAVFLHLHRVLYTQPARSTVGGKRCPGL